MSTNTIRILTVAFLVPCYLIWIYDIKNRCVDAVDLNNKYKKWMRRWSFISSTLCILRLIQVLLVSVRSLCRYFSPVYFPIPILIMMFTTFYQISRLQCCFRFQYPSHFFIILYTLGLIITICTAYTIYISATIIDDPSVGCIANNSDKLFLILICFVAYLLWEF
eukprot:118163_1